MWKQNKRALLLSSLLTLLPILAGLLLWNRLGQLGVASLSAGSRAGLVFGPPLAMLLGHWLGLWLTLRDPKNQGRNQKVVRLVFWIMPIFSNFSCGIGYALALEAPFSPSSLLLTLLGVMFLVIGNYLPKCRQNYTIGIKLPWTFASEENWNATHRFGGRVWMAGGAAMLLFAWIPGAGGLWGTVAAVLIFTTAPVLYSYLYYRRQKARGDAMTPIAKTDSQKRFGRYFVITTLILVPALLVFLFVTLCTGSIRYTFREDCLSIQASFYSDLELPYESIDRVQFQEGDIAGSRIYGVGSLRLLLGIFENEALGSYTRYTYHSPEACLLLTVNGKPLVLSGETREETMALYQGILEKLPPTA